MANSFTRVVRKIDDLTLHQALMRVVQAVSSTKPGEVSQKNIQHWSYTIGGIAELKADPELDVSDWSGQYTVETALLRMPLGGGFTCSVNFSRQVTKNDRTSPSLSFDEFTVHFSSDTGYGKWDDVQQARDIISALFLDFAVPAISGEETNLLPQQVAEFGALHRQMLQSLSNQLDEVASRRRVLEDEHIAKEREREEQHQEALAELETERKKLELESYKARRRSLQSAMTSKTAAERMNDYSPKSIEGLNVLVILLALIAAAAGAYFAYQAVNQMGVNQSAVSQLRALFAENNVSTNEIDALFQNTFAPLSWYLVIKSVLSSLVAIGGLFYAADWTRKIYLNAMKSAKEADQFNYDVLRSNWIIETVLEVTKEHEGEVPDAWLNSVTEGLFSHTDDKQDHESDASAALRALLGMSASAKLGPEGTTIEVGRKGMRKLGAAQD